MAKAAEWKPTGEGKGTSRDRGGQGRAGNGPVPPMYAKQLEESQQAQALSPYS